MSARDKLKTDDLLGNEGINRSIVQGRNSIRNESSTSINEEIIEDAIRDKEKKEEKKNTDEE